MIYACPICASDDVEDTGFCAENDELKVQHRVYGCLNCTGRFLADRPSSIGKVRVSQDARPSEASIEHVRRWFADKKLLDECDYPFSLIPMIEEHAPGKRILEVGCGVSQLLPMLQERGFQVEGFEGDPAGLWLARDRGTTVWTGDWDAISHILRCRQFDCIVSDQVFEHTLRPGHFLRELRELLAPEGKLIFRLPNEGSLRRNLEVALARLKGRDHTRSYFVDHWNYFNSRALRICFQSNGYRVLSLKQDLSPQGFIMGRLLKTMSGHPLLCRAIGKAMALVDSRLLSNGLTIVAASSQPLSREDVPEWRMADPSQIGKLRS
jgi:2-polyprenyl-3-methyl-5-hydroxy-6-metoxy-1,4-benzoquinol methylase